MLAHGELTPLTVKHVQIQAVVWLRSFSDANLWSASDPDLLREHKDLIEIRKYCRETELCRNKHAKEVQISRNNLRLDTRVIQISWNMLEHV